MTKRVAIIENGIVTNIAVYDDDFIPDGAATVLWEQGVREGYTYSGGVFSPPPPPIRWQVPYLTMLDRMTDANASAVGTYIEGLNPKVRERIRAEGVWSDNQTVRDRLTLAGEDPDVILGQP